MEISFYPGPSKLFPEIQKYMQDAYISGILQENHRSKLFMELLKKTIEQFKLKLNIPEGYEVFFTSSATECWEIVNQSLLHGKVQFLYNGAFGKKWFKYAVTNQNIVPCELRGSRFFVNQEASEVELDTENNCICITQNETSNATAISNETIAKIKQTCPKSYIFIDATSSMGGQDLNWTLGDVWLASVQKCFGLPSGMGILIVSKKSLDLAIELNDKNHYNSLLNIYENFKLYQTHYTPNILLIYLLYRTQSTIKSYSKLYQDLENRFHNFMDFIKNETDLEPLVSNPKTQSKTIIGISIDEISLIQLKEKAKKAGIKLGNGYGEWKNSSFRIANFPAISDDDFEALKLILKK